MYEQSLGGAVASVYMLYRASAQ